MIIVQYHWFGLSIFFGKCMGKVRLKASFATGRACYNIGSGCVSLTALTMAIICFRVLRGPSSRLE